MAVWPTTLPAPQKNIGIVPGDTRIDRKLQSGRTEFRKFGDGKPDQMKALFRLTWAEWDIFKEFHAHELNLGINWFSADWLTDLGYDAHKAKILGYPREVALQNYYVDVLCVLIIQATADIVTEDTVWPCEPTGAEPEPPPPSGNGYVYGGAGAVNCDGYDPDTDIWTNKTDMPSLPGGRRYLAASTIGTSGYIYCGVATWPNFLRDCDQYTPDTWISKADCPLSGRYALAASTIGLAGYIYGGSAGNDCDEFTPATNSWASKTNAPSPNRQYHAASTIGLAGYIYGGQTIPDCDEYVASTDTWTGKANMPAPSRFQHAASTIGSAGYIYGGNPCLLDCDQYTPTGDSWTSKPSIPIPGRHQLAASTIGSSGYIYGGYKPAGVTNDCDKYTPDTWISVSNTLVNMYQHAASTI